MNYYNIFCDHNIITKFTRQIYKEHFEARVVVPYTGKFLGEKLANSPKFPSTMVVDTPKMYMAYALTIAYSPNFSLPIAFICIICQNFPVYGINITVFVEDLAIVL